MTSLENITSSELLIHHGSERIHTSPTREDGSSSPTVEALPTEESHSADENNDTIKLASKAFGYIKRSVELLGKESTRLAGARDFSNTLHWTQAMKFLKERGYIYTKTGHGTSVAEQYGTLEGLERAFQDQFKLENFPLPRLSKTHLEKVDTRHYFDENLKSASASMFDYNYPQQYARMQQHQQPPPHHYTMLQHPTANSFAYGNNNNHHHNNNFFQDSNTGSKKPVTSIPMGPYFFPNQAMMPVSPPQPQPFIEQPVARRIPPSESVSIAPPSNKIPSGLQALSVAAQSELPFTRRHSAPDCPLPAMTYNTHMKPPTVDQFIPNNRLEFPAVLPPLTKITSQLPSEDSSKLPSYPKSSSIHALLHIPVAVQNRNGDATDAHYSNRPKTFDADLFQSFCEQLYQDGETSGDASSLLHSRKRAIALPPVTEDQSKKAKVLDYESQWYPPPHAILS